MLMKTAEKKEWHLLSNDKSACKVHSLASFTVSARIYFQQAVLTMCMTSGNGKSHRDAGKVHVSGACIFSGGSMVTIMAFSKL